MIGRVPVTVARIRSYDLSELQLPVLICAFPQLDGTSTHDVDVVRAARRVFLTLNKTAKKVSESRNKLLNDQDMVAECLRSTLSFVKKLSTKDDSGFRIWNVELDQEGDRSKIASDVAFSGVSHLYHLIEQILMATSPARGIEARARVGAPRRRLDESFERLGLKDDLTSDQKNVNTRVNYSDEIAAVFRQRWEQRYLPLIDRLYAKVHPFAAFARATLALNIELIGTHDTVLEKMLFDGQATARTFDDFQAGLNRRVSDKEPNWTTPEIKESLARVNGLLANRRSKVEAMKDKRALFFLDSLSSAAKKKVTAGGEVAKPLREAIDAIFEDVVSTVAFQTAVVCTYVEAVQSALGGVERSTPETVAEYISALNRLFEPRNIDDLEALMRVFRGQFQTEPEVKLIAGGPTFRHVVLPGELQPAEWPKFRYLLLELWNPSNEALRKMVEEDRTRCRASVAQSLYRRRINSYCAENRVAEEDLTREIKLEILTTAKSMFESFLEAVVRAKVAVDAHLFDQSTPAALAEAGERGETSAT